ncbi:MAG TPA: PLP-dependent aspartate aminotransferase family protein [Terriglobales bacterium]|nr:PLP-dependent aspartate aminotransferase family protein [Terriglobales bacterium]
MNPTTGFSTRAIHAGQAPDPTTGAVNVPIYATSTYVQEEIGKHKGYEYSRVSNPTRTALEENLAALESGHSAHVFASGMAAISAVLTRLSAGDHVVCGRNVYGGTPRLFNQVLQRFGLRVTYVDTRQPEQVDAAFGPSTRLLFVETPTNPLMELCDLRVCADLAHRHGAELVVDNTFMSPYFQCPLALGADMVVHSTTKFLNGHSDGLGGVVVASSDKQAEDLRFIQKSVGAILSPFECFLLLRGVKTLAVRMRQHDASGRRIAAWLAQHPKVRAVYYPGLESHPQHALARRQMTGFGSMITFETGSLDNANRVLKSVRLCSLAESLGGVETLISHPATMTHAAIGVEGRAAIGLTDGMVRISVGLEDVEDIEADLDQALANL